MMGIRAATARVEKGGRGQQSGSREFWSSGDREFWGQQEFWGQYMGSSGDSI